MLDNELKSYLLPNLFNAAVRAGAAIMQVYKNKEDYDISIKSDKTPITVGPPGTRNDQDLSGTYPYPDSERRGA